MNIERKEIFVRDIRTDTSGGFIVICIPNNGKVVRVGDVFMTRYDSPQTVEDILRELPRPAPTNCVEISLTVTAIDYMRHKTKELPHGVTGALHLTGKGIESVTPNCFLMT